MVNTRIFRRALTFVFFAGCLSACGDPIEGLRDVEAPLLRIRVQTLGEIVKLLPPGETLDGQHLRAALVWGAVPSPVEFCLEYGLGLGGEASATTVALAGCKSVFDFVPRLVQASAPIQADGSATIELLHLPTAEVLVGSPSGRVAHGSIVIYDDRDENKALVPRRGGHQYVCRENGGGPNGNRPSNCPPENAGQQGKDNDPDAVGADAGGTDAGSTNGASSGGENRGGKGGKEGEGPGQGQDYTENEKPLDFIYGASFRSMLSPHVRVTYREGTYDLGSFFYPTIGCSAPPAGFSVVHVSGPPTKSECEYKNVQDTVIEIPLQATATVSEVICKTQNFHFHDSRRRPDLKQPYVCIDGNALVAATPPSACRALSSVSLRGCRAKHDCTQPDWDDHLKPPDWWPCGTYIDPIEKKKREKAAKEGAGKEQGSGAGSGGKAP